MAFAGSPWVQKARRHRRRPDRERVSAEVQTGCALPTSPTTTPALTSSAPSPCKGRLRDAFDGGGLSEVCDLDPAFWGSARGGFPRRHGKAVAAIASEAEVDVSGVTIISSAGLSVLLAAHRRFLDGGGRMVLVEPSPRVIRLLEITGLAAAFTVQPASGCRHERWR